MINLKESPEAWASLMYNLEDARDHLNDLVTKMNKDGQVSEEEFAVRLGHVFFHLNSGWNSRNLTRAVQVSEWPQLSKFPDDLNPS